MAEAHKRAHRHPRYKTAYRVRNWREYEKSLRDRGDITIWFNQEAIDAWTPPTNAKRGGQPVYSDLAIETALTLRLLFHLPLRQTEGFLGSILKLMGIDHPCPDHTTLSRRNRTIEVRRHLNHLPDGPLSFVVDSTGLKICGQGEWHTHKHGVKYRKRWKKLHLGVDENGWILASKITDGHHQDPSQVPDLLGQVDRPIRQFVADGIYDQEPVHDAVEQHSPGATIIVPPRKEAVLSGEAPVSVSQRDRHIEAIKQAGRFRWKRESGYYLQSHAENGMSRHKRIIGGRLRAKRDEAQEREALVGCSILNRMREMGRPQSYPIG
jgi:hypothetical protein